MSGTKRDILMESDSDSSEFGDAYQASSSSSSQKGAKRARSGSSGGGGGKKRKKASNSTGWRHNSHRASPSGVSDDDSTTPLTRGDIPTIVSAVLSSIKSGDTQQTVTSKDNDPPPPGMLVKSQYVLCLPRAPLYA